LRWSWCDQELRLGQRVRIETIDPRGADLGELREIVTYGATTLNDARAELKELTRDLARDGYGRRAAQQAAYERGRPAPRSYPRAPIRLEARRELKRS
jgi:hypothetical protein